MGAGGQGAQTKKGGGGEQASGSRGYSKNVAVPLVRLSGGMVKNPQCALKGTYIYLSAGSVLAPLTGSGAFGEW